MRRTLISVILCILVLGTATTVLAADVTAGKASYERLCMACHGPNGVGASGPALNTAGMARQLQAGQVSTTVRRGASGMPA